jgi:hypothetical protein
MPMFSPGTLFHIIVLEVNRYFCLHRTHCFDLVIIRSSSFVSKITRSPLDCSNMNGRRVRHYPGVGRGRRRECHLPVGTLIMDGPPQRSQFICYNDKVSFFHLISVFVGALPCFICFICRAKPSLRSPVCGYKHGIVFIYVGNISVIT